MTLKEKNMLKQKCEECKKNIKVWVEGLDSDVEKTEEMLTHAENYCPACLFFRPEEQ